MHEITFWDKLTEEEKKIAIEAVNNFQEQKLRKERIDALKEKVFNNVETLYDLMTYDEWDDFVEDLKNKFLMT